MNEIFNSIRSNFKKFQANRIVDCYSNIEDSIDLIEKSGAGSRGGRIIGYTRSGKPIYDSHDHESHSSFTKEDHNDAANLHKEKVKYHREKLDDLSKKYQNMSVDDMFSSDHGVDIQHEKHHLKQLKQHRENYQKYEEKSK